MTGFDFQTVKKIFRKVSKQKDQGAALIVALLVMMVLVLLGLALILQSQTEYLGAVNENDSLSALSFAESGLEWAERKIKEEASGHPDLDMVLRGPDDATGTPETQVDDNLFGIRTMDTSLTLSDLNLTNEQTVSVRLAYDWDNDTIAEHWEVFRTGTDLNDDNVWDGPRAILWMRIEDNYDGPTSGVQDLDDDDWRARIRVRVQYPIFVDETGAAQDPVLATRGTAERRIEGRLSPAQGVAIRTNKQFDGRGTYKVCGACGGIHSNGEVDSTGSSAQICSDFTATGDFDTNGQGPTVGGTSGGNQPEQFIPTINPYDPKFVPSVNTFDHLTDAELNVVEPVGTILQCAPATQEDPGSSKYFALVFKTTDGELQVWKAYWDFAGGSGASRWLWRLIDVGPTLTAVLDNCGRLVSNVELGLGADACPDGRPGCDGSDFATQAVSDIVDCCGSPWPPAEGGDGSTYCDPNCMDPGPDTVLGTVDDINRCRADGAISACDGTTSGDDQFYGFKGGGNFSTDSCPGDDSLSGLNENDYARDNFFTYPTGQNSDAGVPSLPETWLKDGLGGDDQPDFKFATVTQTNRQKWSNDTTTIFSPLYNAVIFGFGNLHFNGDMINGKMQFYDPNPTAPSLPGTYTATAPNNRWRVSLISYGRIDVRGGARFGPANGGTGACATVDDTLEACHVGFVAGRDLDLAGDNGTGCADPTQPGCNLCPDLSADPGADCTDGADTVPFGFEGMFLAHEQVNLSGNSNFAGFMIAEEAANCVETQPQAEQTRMNGNPDIYYDCESPPDPWLSDLLRITSWEEVQ